MIEDWEIYLAFQTTFILIAYIRHYMEINNIKVPIKIKEPDEIRKYLGLKGCPEKEIGGMV